VGWKMWGPISGRGRTGDGAEGDGVRRHTLLSVRMNEWSNITTPPARLHGEHSDNCTCAASACCTEDLAVWHARASSAMEVPGLLEVDVVGLVGADTTDGVSVWIGLSCTKL
jgi:hypothetical protein